LYLYDDVEVGFNDDGVTRTIGYFTIIEETPKYRYGLSLTLMVDYISGDVEQMIFSCTKSDGNEDTSRDILYSDIESYIIKEKCLEL
jgi:hypothetical protein